MEHTSVNLHCPRCRLPGEAVLDESAFKCILYTCPRCHSNVVYYDNKIDIITDECLNKLLKKKKLQFCGNVTFKGKDEKPKRRRPLKKKEPSKTSLSHDKEKPISKDDVLNLKILLDTEDDLDSILSQL